MKVIVIGGTGNVGTSTVAALSGSAEVDEVVAVARRRATLASPKASFVAGDILHTDLREIFAGADAVIHLAWAIQPSRDLKTLELINLLGSRRVFAAAAEAEVPALIYASSVGVYSQAPDERPVDESWRTDGTATSFYSRHKVAVERALDETEAANPQMRIVRMRPALTFKGDAATEIRRFFIGPFLPSFALHRNFLPALPRIDGLYAQVVHADDVAQAYLRVVLSDVRGPFNLAADPPLSAELIARQLDRRTFPVPVPIARGLVDLSWRARLQPTSPGWFDMGRNVPVMSTERARNELDWTPTRSGTEVLSELMEAMRDGRGDTTPPLAPDSLRGRIDDLRSGVGARQWHEQRADRR